jgi:peroxiredoxin
VARIIHKREVRFGFCAAALTLSALHLASAEPRLKAPAPPLAITATDGRAFDLDSMRGKVVLVLFWATWCGPCLAEMPAVEKYYRRHKAEGFDVIALSTDRPENRDKVAKELSRLPFPGALLSDATRNGFGKPEAVPVSYVVDANGTVRDTFIAIDERLLNKAVSPLLKQKSVTPDPAGKQE